MSTTGVLQGLSDVIVAVGQSALIFGGSLFIALCVYLLVKGEGPR